MKFLQKIILPALIFCLFWTHTSLASDVSFSPTLIDLEMEAREVVTRDITITNNSESKFHLYATVNEIDIDNAGAIKEFVAPVMDTREKSITSWIEITRGRIELEPGETKTVPISVRVNQDAQVGEYHAFIGLIKEVNRPLAEAKVMAGNGEGIILKVAVQDRAAASLRIMSFLSKKFIIKESHKLLEVQVKNEGTKNTIPAGEVIFYDSQGREVASSPLSAEGASIEPGKTEMFKVSLPSSMTSLGRFKANVVVRYGKDNQQAVFDTTQFYLIPPLFVAIFAVIVVLLSLLITYLLRRSFYDELHDEEDGREVPLYVRDNKEHVAKDHDIHLKKN